MTQQKNGINGWLKVIITIVVIGGTSLIAWGEMRIKVNKGETEVKRLDDVKVEKEVFEMHMAEQRRSNDKIDKTLIRMEEKLDKVIAKDG